MSIVTYTAPRDPRRWNVYVLDEDRKGGRALVWSDIADHGILARRAAVTAGLVPSGAMTLTCRADTDPHYIAKDPPP